MANKSRKLQDAYIMSSIKSTMLLASAVLVDRNDFTPEMLDQFFEDCATLLDSMGEGTDKWGTVNDNLAEVLEGALNRIKESEKQLEKEELVGKPLEIEEFKDALDVIESLDVAAVIGRLPDGATTHNDDVLQHLLELSYTLDKYSAGKDYIELRKAHYKNIEWLHNHGLTDMYYDVLFGQIKDEKEKSNKNVDTSPVK